MFTDKGRIFMFGSNEWGQLGLGHTNTVTKPTRIKDKSRLKCSKHNDTVKCDLVN